MNPILEIFSQGDEVVTGQTVDTNAAWLAQACVEMGFNVTRHTAVGDRLDDLIRLLREISERADCCLCTGGLGPTVDDLTAEAVAQAFTLPLRFDPIAYENIERFFRHRKRPMAETNRKQAMIPEGAERIDNEWGTAPGFALHYRRCRFVFLPGVPFEMRHLFDEKVKPLLLERFSLKPSKLVTIKTVGIGESDLQTLLDTLALPEPVQLGFRAGVEHVETKLLFPADFPVQQVTDLAGDVSRLIGPFVFAVDGINERVGTLVDAVDRLMVTANKTLNLMETVSQGAMAAKCLGRSWLKGSVYEPSPENMARRLGVAFDRDDLPTSGYALANALWSPGTSDIVVVQLCNGSSSDFHDKDQIIEIHTTLVHNIEFEQTSMAQERRGLWGTPERKQNQAALFGLDLLRRHLQTETT
ncbi:MAG: competence/damage-inducible protein A [Gammaproteobacteria bacterium]